MLRRHKFGTCTLLALTLAALSLAQEPTSEGEKQRLSANASQRGGGAVKTNLLSPSISPETSWAPADVDTSVPAVAPDVTCALPDVLKSAGQRAEELVNILPQFTATEEMQHLEFGKSGEWSKPSRLTFNYLVEMKKLPNGMLYMDETRDGGTGLYRFPQRLATTGLPVVAMVFHPTFVGDYDMTCEGLGRWDGRPAWQIRFVQRRDKYPRMRGYRVKDQSWAVRLKGRAWLDSESSQPLHIETDILEPLNIIALQTEHLMVDYRPVHFDKQKMDLWLQSRAEVFFDYRGHRYHRIHTFSNFLLFTVDVDQKDKLPPGE